MAQRCTFSFRRTFTWTSILGLWRERERERDSLISLPHFMSSVGDLRFAHSACLTLLILQLRKRGGGGAKGPQEQLVYTGENGALSGAALNIQTASLRLCCVKDGVRGEKSVLWSRKTFPGDQRVKNGRKTRVCFSCSSVTWWIFLKGQRCGGKNDEKIRVSVLRWTLGSGGRRHPV